MPFWSTVKSYVYVTVGGALLFAALFYAFGGLRMFFS